MWLICCATPCEKSFPQYLQRPKTKNSIFHHIFRTYNTQIHFTLVSSYIIPRPSPCIKMTNHSKKGSLCRHSCIGFQRLHSQTRMSSCGCRLWFRASLWSPTLMYPSSSPWYGHCLPGQVWYGQNCRLCPSHATPIESHCLPCWRESSERIGLVSYSWTGLPDCTLVWTFLEVSPRSQVSGILRRGCHQDEQRCA